MQGSSAPTTRFLPFELSADYKRMLEWEAKASIVKDCFDSIGDPDLSQEDSKNAQTQRNALLLLKQRLQEDQTRWETSQVDRTMMQDPIAYSGPAQEYKAFQAWQYSGFHTAYTPPPNIKQYATDQLKVANDINATLPENVMFPGTIDLVNYDAVATAPVLISSHSLLYDWLGALQRARLVAETSAANMRNSRSLTNDGHRLTELRSAYIDHTRNEARSRFLVDHIDNIRLLQETTFRGTLYSDCLTQAAGAFYG